MFRSNGFRRIIPVLALIFGCHAGISKVRQIRDMSAEQYEQLLSPTYHHGKAQHASHDMNIHDDQGQYIKLSYTAKHPDYANFLKLDEASHRPNFLSLSCTVNDANEEIVILRTKSHATAAFYHQEIQASLSHAHKRHFLSAKHKWGCFNPHKWRFQSLLREITSIRVNQTDLILTTDSAGLLDVFESLDVTYTTNMNRDHFSQKAGFISTDVPATVVHTHGVRRRLGGFWGRLWKDVKSGVEAAVEWLADAISKVTWSEIAQLTAIVSGMPVDIEPRNTTSMWSWNYDPATGERLTVVNVSTNLTCVDCYSELNVTWTLKVSIDERELKYLLVSADGDMRVVSDLIVTGAYKAEDEWTEQTLKEAFPELSFEVAGVQFDVDIHGSMSIGLDIADGLDFFMGGFSAKGKIRKGLEYNTSTHDQYNYISEQAMDYGLMGPKTTFQSGDLMYYARPMLYFDMSGIGDFYFGLQPTFDVELDKDDESSKCVVHYTPSLKLNTFMGADLEVTHWHKKAQIAGVQTNLDTLAGCIDRSDVLENQVTKAEIIEERKEASDSQIWKWLMDGNPTWMRRRLATAAVDADGAQSTLIDYPKVKLNPKYSDSDRWDDRSLEWWGNLSTISDVCSDWNKVCQDYDLNAIRPHVGTLTVSADDEVEHALIAVYSVVVEVVPSAQWDIVDANMMGNISCLARHRLELLSDEYEDDGIRTFNVTLLETYCDAELSDLGLDAENNSQHHEAWECMIRLPEKITAISLDASLGGIVLFDAGEDWCHVFTLATKPQYELRPEVINWERVQRPSKLWYGIWDCEPLFKMGAKESQLQFVSYDKETGDVGVILHLNREESFRFSGNVDLYNMKMTLRSDVQQAYWTDGLEFVGVLTLLQDGTIIYAGSIEHEECTGFLFQGFLNITEFERRNAERAVVDSGEEGEEDSKTPLDGTSVVKDSDGWVTGTNVLIYVMGMATSAIIIVVVASVCRHQTQKQRGKNYELMNDTML